MDAWKGYLKRFPDSPQQIEAVDLSENPSKQMEDQLAEKEFEKRIDGTS